MSKIRNALARSVGAAHLLLPLAFCLVTGCGPSTGTISGSVTIDGKPLDSGVISFVPAEEGSTPATANIAAGKYQLSTTTGKKIVQISAPIVVGKRKEYEGPDAPLVEITEERLPPKYNSQTELNIEVKAGANTQDFSLTSIRKK